MIGKIVGSTIGVIIRLILLIATPIKDIFEDIADLFNVFKVGFDSIPAPLQKIIKIVGIIAALIIAGPVGAVIALIAIFDDLFTYLRGGKSVIGSFFNKLKDGMKSIKDDWDYYYNKAKTVFEKLEAIVVKPFKKIKEWVDWLKNTFAKGKDFVINSVIKAKDFVNQSTTNSVPPSYTTSNNSSNSTSTANSNNTVKNENTFNVYGSGNANSTAKATANTLTGVTIRNLQGVY